jgi:SAM-dependent methyltransferase
VLRSHILDRVKALRPWFHAIDLGDGITTKDLKDPSNLNAYHNNPVPLWDAIKDTIPANLYGKKVLDVGCNAGFFSFELHKRGARVVGIDTDQEVAPLASFIEQAQFCSQVLKADIRFYQRSLFDMPETERFDMILFLGVFYHIENFCDALEKLNRLCVPGGLLAFESEISAKSGTFYDDKEYHGDPSTFFVPSANVLDTLLVEHGFRIHTKRVVLGSIKRGRYYLLCSREEPRSGDGVK